MPERRKEKKTKTFFILDLKKVGQSIVCINNRSVQNLNWGSIDPKGDYKHTLKIYKVLPSRVYYQDRARAACREEIQDLNVKPLEGSMAEPLFAQPKDMY